MWSYPYPGRVAALLFLLISLVLPASPAGAQAVDPTPPGRVEAAATGVASVDVSWSPVDGATSYLVSRDGIDMVEVTSLGYSDSGLREGTEHLYQVRTKVGDRVSDYSDPAVVVTEGEPAFPVPTGLRVAYVSETVLVTQHDRVPGATGYEIIDNGIFVGRSNSDGWAVLGGLEPGTRHEISVVAIGDQARSPRSSAVVGLTVPGQPDRAVISTTTSTSVTMVWADLSGAFEWIVYRDGEAMGTLDPATGSLTDDGLEPNSTHWYSVSAAWPGAQNSRWSEPRFATTRPEAGLDITVRAGAQSDGVHVEWETAIPNVTKYRVYRNGFVYQEIPDGSGRTLIQIQGADRTVEVKVSAIVDGREVAVSEPLDVLIPLVPRLTPVVEVAYRSEDRLVVSHTFVVGADEYRVYVSGRFAGTSHDGWFVADGLEAGTAYEIEVVGVQAGRERWRSDLVPGLTTAERPVNAITTFWDHRNVVLRFEDPAGDVGHRFRIYRDGVAVGLDDGLGGQPFGWYVDHDLEPGTPYVYWIATVGDDGFESRWSEPVFVQTRP